ncbi:MAG TPA: hypothetical protein VFW27_28085, partial [Actinoplanes sp.]|nr:hypothetical protein [Actinoplanes sp.]
MGRAKAARTSGAKLRPGNAWRSGTTTAKDAWIAGPGRRSMRAVGELRPGVQQLDVENGDRARRAAGSQSRRREACASGWCPNASGWC